VSKGPATTAGDRDHPPGRGAGSAVLAGRMRTGSGALVAEGAVIRSPGTAVELGAGSAVLENSVVVGTTLIPVTIGGGRTTFGHRCLVIGATIGDLAEIGNASILMPGARVGDRVFLASVWSGSSSSQPSGCLAA
jgi:carbonic anhydrase/acetyltransferase-like protein (isoleucine patch superfamily)